LNDNTFAKYVQNLSEPHQDATGDIPTLLGAPRQYVYAYGTFYPIGAAGRFEAQWLLFPGRGPGVFRHEEPDWWINQLRSIGKSYMKWQFDYPKKEVDFQNYRTVIKLGGEKKGDTLQETDTISRLTCGLSSAYMLTGDEAFLDAAEKGVQYMRDHMRFYDQDEDLIYWYHGIKMSGDRQIKLLTSEFGDDLYSIPIYEQIYALTGLTMCYRLTGDPKVMWDIKKTVKIFDRFKDHKGCGYFSHIDPIDFDPQSPSLEHNCARKNWNSIGDHAPAYLVSLYLATGDPVYAKFLEETFDCITKYFPDFVHSPFVKEKFNVDWSQDRAWLWQQNRAVIGHNMKIVWNLMRMNSLKQKEEYIALAHKIAELMPAAGSDLQRGGWYDMVDREIKPDGKHYRFSWHDRKAWWQQEQAILAYLVLHGITPNEAYLQQAHESAAFYNAFFLDHDDGGIYYNVFANGLPYLLQEARFKGSHSIGGYHSMELCFFAAVYINLLINKQPMMFYFKPYPDGFPDNLLRVAPDLLPEGSIHIEECWIDNNLYFDFDSIGLTVKLPDSKNRHTVKVKIAPSNGEQRGEKL
jgi:mannose/cellobiose epimerase-like protein (N-acyl-D-glucosamine 2-epimerase family)